MNKPSIYSKTRHQLRRELALAVSVQRLRIRDGEVCALSGAQVIIEEKDGDHTQAAGRLIQEL